MLPCKRWSGTHRKSDGRPIYKKRYVYRIEWEKVHGPLPPSVKLHHKCEHEWCIEVTHLEPLSQREHAIEHQHGGDWGQADKTHCPADHEYTPENTYVYKRKDGRTERHCQECRKATKARYNARQRAKKAA